MTAALGQVVAPLLRDQAPHLLAIRPAAGSAERSAKRAAHTGREDAGAVSAAVRPVLQLTEFPIGINPAVYTNPRCAANPNGDLRSARAFRDLVDPVPGFSSGYLPSALSTELIYKAVLAGAQTDGARLLTNVLADAQMMFESSAMPSLDGSTIDWHLVDAMPWTWYDTTQLQPVTIALDGGPASPFEVIGDGPLQWRLDGAVSELSPASRLETVTLECQMVVLSRPWLRTELFSMSGWSLPPEPAGYCSSGRIDTNDGILPLLPSALLVGRVNAIGGQWGGSDLTKLMSVQSGRSVSLGPFPVEAVAQDGTLRGSGGLGLIGVVSQLIPYSPHT